VISIYRVCMKGGESSKWDNYYYDDTEFRYWEIPFTWLLDPEFQKQFETEFHTRLLSSIFS
jgi:hypothetical protein